MKPGLRPQHFVLLQPFFLRDFQGRAGVELMNKRPRRLAALLENLRVIGFDFPLHLIGNGAVPQRRAVVGRPLENRKVSHLFGYLGNQLHCGSSGADHPHPLAGQVHAFLRPSSRVTPCALVGIQTLEIRHVERRQQANRRHQERRPGLVPVLNLHQPGVPVFLKGTDRDPRVEPYIPPQVELVGDIIQVTLVFGLTGVKLLPVPFLEQLLGEGIPIGVALRVEARAGIAVPVPRSADAAAVFKDPDRHPQLPETMKLVKPGHPGSDDDCVKLFDPIVGNGPVSLRMLR